MTLTVFYNVGYAKALNFLVYLQYVTWCKDTTIRFSCYVFGVTLYASVTLASATFCVG